MEIPSHSADVIFMSYDEPQADAHFRQLQRIVPWVHRVQGVLGIDNAYRAAGEKARTQEFFTVDGDTWVLDSFVFKIPENLPSGTMCLWPCKNAVNGILGLNGAVKLINKCSANCVKIDAVDYFGSMPGDVRSYQHVAGENRFNSSPFAAWRAGFRECAKLAGGVVRRTDVAQQLNIWQTIGDDKPNGIECILGARLGANFGASNWESPVLRKINNPDFLRDEYIKMLARIQGKFDFGPEDSLLQARPVGSARISLNGGN